MLPYIAYMDPMGDILYIYKKINYIQYTQCTYTWVETVGMGMMGWQLAVPATNIDPILGIGRMIIITCNYLISSIIYSSFLVIMGILGLT